MTGPRVGGRLLGSRSLAVVALLLAIAFVVAPFWLTGRGIPGEAALSRWAGDDFVAFWRAGDLTRAAGMSDLVDYWMRFHIVKAVAAGLLVVVLAVLATRMWRSFVDGTVTVRRRRFAGVAGTVAAAGGLGAVFLLMANVQGAIAPLSSALSLVPMSGRDPALRQVRGQVAQQLQAGDTSRSALARMIDDFGTYHAVLAVCAVVVACAAAVLAVIAARSFLVTARTDRSGRRATVLVGAVFGLVGVGVAILAVANIGNAADPAHALLLFYTG
ncbi:hypothetical protein ACQ7HM_02515 [Williamsia sp. MIQD14]|uniref:hypothetical protein n=1 Tax=Williamsia sp. MIQD14 TaxID=3425703 RepID=UPI003DA0CE2F